MFDDCICDQVAAGFLRNKEAISYTFHHFTPFTGKYELDYEQPLFFRSPSSVKQKKKNARKLGTRRAEAKREKMRDYPLSHSI